MEGSRRASIPNRFNIQSAARQLLKKKKDEEKVQRDKERAALSATTEALKQLKASHESEKKEKEELEEKLQKLQVEHDTVVEQLEKSRKAVENLRSDNKRKTEYFEKMERDHVTMEDRMKNLEARALETEKMELMVDSIRKSLESSQVECRDYERELRHTKSELDSANRQLEQLMKTMAEEDSKAADLKLQVQEELIRNQKMEKKLIEMQKVEQLMQQKEQTLLQMRAQLQDKALLLEHARTSAREARDKCKDLEDRITNIESMREELKVAKGETMTLKQLMLGKDMLIVQQAQALQIAKRLLNDLDPEGGSLNKLQHLLEQLHTAKSKSTSKPAHSGDTDKIHDNDSSQMNGSSGQTDHGNRDSVSSDQQSDQHSDQQAHSTHSHSARIDYSHYMNTRLLDSPENNSNQSTPRYSPGFDQSKRFYYSPLYNGKHKRIKSAVVKPTIRSPTPQKKIDIDKTPYHSNSQSPALTSSSTSLSQSRTSFLETLLQNDSDKEHMNKRNANSCNSSVASNTNSSIHHDTFTDFRTELTKPKLKTVRPCNGYVGQVNYLNSHRSVDTSDGLDSSRVILNGLTQQEWERLAAHCVRVGDRVLVNLSLAKKKDKLYSGVVKFIGQVDMGYPDLRLHVGIKMDDPVGNMDGVYQGKRYFSVGKKHGRLLKITDVISVLNSKISSYQHISDRIEQILIKRRNTHRLYASPR